MLEFLLEYRAIAQQVVSILVGAAALRWGGGPEKAVAAVFVGFFIIPAIVLDFSSDLALLFLSNGAFYTVIDIIAALAFTVIAVNANRNYTLWIAGFQLVAASAHGVRYVVEAVSPLAHAMLVIGPSYFQLLLMLIGLIRHIRRKKRHGDYRDWRIPQSQLDLAALRRGTTNQ